MNILFLIFLLAVLLSLGFFAAPGWLAAGVMVLATGGLVAAGAGWPLVALAGTVALILLAASLPILRRVLVSNRLLAWFQAVMPAMSATEREALESGTVWWDAELFSGRPRWRRLLDAPAPSLTPEERDFLDGPVEELCAVLDEWEINHRFHDLPPEAWGLIRKHRFFSMIIPKEYGGLGFTNQGNAAVVTKLASRNQSAATTVMVPNSLGPGELLHYFGTEEQKHHYLPRLAACEEIPCFALTSPLAGSDAASMPDQGIICTGRFEGEEVLGLRVSWDKRYITLAPVATLVGLAFKAFDPDGLLGDRVDLGITCALIPADTPGVQIGNRHVPGGSTFMNGPVRGTDVFVPLDWVIGGRQGIGRGWSMLMHCLSAGRAISLPALSVANAKMASLLTGAYARIRHQFKQPIGHFEGIEEPLARIGGETYRMDAAHRMTLVALDRGEKPAVLSAILKANLTESNRRVLNDAMDIHGGKTVIEGPRNYLSGAFHSIPVAITVEGANILTRSMIIFGQGAIRCHPWLLKEMQSAQSDAPDAHKHFDRALFGHFGYTTSNAIRALALGLTGGRLSPSPVPGPVARYYRRINRLCASFTLVADLALLILGGKFKFKEKLSGRFADALSHLYLVSAVLKRYEDEHRPEEDLPLLHWAAADSLHRVEEALFGILDNFPSPLLGRLLRLWCFPFGRTHKPADDRVGHRIARLLMQDHPARERLTAGVYRSRANDGAGLVNQAFAAVLAAEDAEHAIANALKQPVNPVNARALTEKAVDAGIITEQQAVLVREAQRLSAEVIAVDEFEPGEIGQNSPGKPRPDLSAVAN